MVPAGAVITGRIFSQNLVPPISPQVFEYGKVRRWVLRTPIPKRGMATKKGAIQKTPPVPCEARDTAFRAGFLCSFLSPAVTKERRAADFPRKRTC